MFSSSPACQSLVPLVLYRTIVSILYRRARGNPLWQSVAASLVLITSPPLSSNSIRMA
jgi:hypothetical protein